MIETRTYSDGTVATGLAPLPHQSPAQQVARSWANGVCPSCGGDEWDIERNAGTPSIYTCPCGAWDHVS